MFLDNLLPASLGAIAAPMVFIKRLRYPEMVSFGLLASLAKMRSRKVIKDIDSIWDIGANQGQFAFMAHHVWPHLPVYSFEPDPDTYKRLKKNFKRFHIPGETFCCALSDKVESKFLQRYKDGVNNSLLEREIDIDTFLEHVTVDCTTLDKVSQPHLAKSAFLKLDVQGFELVVLSGAVEFLKKCRYVQVEVSFSPAYAEAAHAGEIIVAMRGYGFECIEILDLLRQNTGSRQIIEADLLFQRTDAH